MGRVPFRKGDEDPPVRTYFSLMERVNKEGQMVLWNKILYDPWDDYFKDPKLARYAPDQTTYKFIDAVSALFSQGSQGADNQCSFYRRIP